MSGKAPSVVGEPPSSRWVISIVWAHLSILVVVLSAYLTGLITGLIVYLDPVIMVPFTPICIAISVLHPGGWLGLAGLILALKKRSYRWLYLSLAGAIITGATVPYIISEIVSLA